MNTDLRAVPGFNILMRKDMCSAVQYAHVAGLPTSVQDDSADATNSSRNQVYYGYTKTIQGAAGRGDRKVVPKCVKRLARQIYAPRVRCACAISPPRRMPRACSQPATAAALHGRLDAAGR